jgi:PAS domain S-box-containing protein
MDLHPGPEKRRAQVKPSELDSIGRALQNEDLYQDLVEHSQDLLCIHDLEGRLLSVNPAPARVLGYSVEEMLRIPMREMIPPEFGPQFEAYLAEIASRGESHGLMAVMTRAGERRIWEYHNTLRTEGVASPIVRGIAHDVTEQKRTEKLLREASEDLLDKVREGERTIRELKLFRTLVDHSNDAVEVVDPETLRFLDVNEKASSALGYSREELLSLRVFDTNGSVNETSVPKIIEELRRVGFVVMESLHRRKDGSTFPVEVSMRLVHLDREYIVAIARDLTERKQSEARLLASENRYRALHERSPAGICWVESGTGRFLGVNPKYCEIAGRTEEDLLARDFQSITHPDDLVENCEKLRALVAGEVRHYEMEKRYVRPDGSIRWVEAAVVAMGPEGEIPVWHMAIVQDITERKIANEALRESEERFRQMADNVQEIFWMLDAETKRVIYVSPAYEAVTGRTCASVYEAPLSYEEAIHTDDRARVLKKLEELVRTGRFDEELRITRPDGSVRWVWARGFPIRDAQGNTFRLAGVAQDITERKQAEERQREYARVVEGLEEMIVVVDREYRYVIANRGFLHYRDMERTQVVGHLVEEVVGREAFENVIRKKMDECFEGKVVQYELKFGFPKLGERDLFASYFPIEGPKGVDRIAIILRDITERKQAEEALRRSEENYRLFVSQSSEAIFREDLDAPVSIDIPEDELIHHILYKSRLAECNDALAVMYGWKSGQELRGKRLSEIMPPRDPFNIEVIRQFIRSGFRLLGHESHEVDKHGNPKVVLNSMIGTVEDGKLVRTWGIAWDITERVKLEESRWRAQEALRQNVAQLQEVTEELRVAKEKLSEEKLYLEQTIDTELGFGEIVGRSSALKEVMKKVAKVAPSDATVLLLGETGTGKELVARALHRMSQRENQSFIKLNCAAIPSGLLESELFGHEKGAFTGAVSRKLGRLELADRGTLFLDEVGEIPLSLQPKLLRVLQDLEFERLGGTQTLRVNFRLLAATNRDLLQAVKAREFRSDLYYRLNVFPILMPPLRERREDIRPLIEHFVHKFAAQMKKSITSIPSKTMEMLVRWDWPGNIRELENFVERSVILTPGSVLQAPLSELQTVVERGGGVAKDSLRDQERERILRVLRDCHGRLGGPDGAAARLGLKRTTLQSKLSQYGIKPGTYRV